eukprot:4532097-Prymnesium_polylepis.1
MTPSEVAALMGTLRRQQEREFDDLAREDGGAVWAARQITARQQTQPPPAMPAAHDDDDDDGVGAGRDDAPAMFHGVLHEASLSYNVILQRATNGQDAGTFNEVRMWWQLGMSCVGLGRAPRPNKVA